MFPDWIEKLLERKQINRYLIDEYVLVYKPWNYAQCLALIEGAEVITKAEMVEGIVSVLLGVPSRLFKWEEEGDGDGRFNVSSAYRLESLNVDPLKDYLKPFAILGTQYRTMWEWTEKEFLYGDIFNAFQLALRDVLVEVSERVFEAKQCFVKKDFGDGSRVRLPAILPWLDEDEMGRIPLVIRTLWSIYSDVVKPIELSVKNENDGFFDHIQTINMKRHYCSQTLVAIYNRIAIPHRRIRSLIYTMLDRCLRAFFGAIEKRLARFETIDELDHLELPFASSYDSDDEFYLKKYNPSEMKTFWNSFIQLDLESFNSLTLFDSDHFKVLVEAIKCSFALRKNGLAFVANDHLKLGGFMGTFRNELERLFQSYAHDDEKFDIRNDQEIETITYDINEEYRFRPLQVKRFCPYQLPIKISKDMNTIMREALAASLEKVSRPIINNFLNQIVGRYRRLFMEYANFYLVQHPQPILQYVFFLFPTLKNILVHRQFHYLETLLRSIHLNDTSDFAQTLQSFQPSLSNLKRLETYPDLLELSVGIFDHILFVPRFSKTFNETFVERDQEFIDFWPLTQMFNSKITYLYNQIFQFLLRLRFFMFIIGNDFILSNAFKSGDLTKNSYLFRFRQANLITHFAQQMDYNLKEVVGVTIERLEKVTTFNELLEEHQRFLMRLEKIKTGLVGNVFVGNVLKSVSKFVLAGHKDRRTNRRLSLQNAFSHLDRINPVDLFNSLLN